MQRARVMTMRNPHDEIDDAIAQYYARQQEGSLPPVEQHPLGGLAWAARQNGLPSPISQPELYALAVRARRLGLPEPVALPPEPTADPAVQLVLPGLLPEA